MKSRAWQAVDPAAAHAFIQSVWVVTPEVKEPPRAWKPTVEETTGTAECVEQQPV